MTSSKPWDTVFPDDGNPDCILRINGLRMCYVVDGKGAETVRDSLRIDGLCVRKGEFFSVVGPSGSGKSTLINLVAGFLRPTAGAIVKNGMPVTEPGPDRVVVFQNHALLPWYTAEENVAYGLKGRMIAVDDVQAKVADALRLVGLESCAQAYPAELSGGMRQRVSLARALVMQPDIMLLDEPFAALDVATRSALQDETLRLWERFRWTTIMVTHNLNEAAYMSDRVALLFPPPRGLTRIIMADAPRPRKRDDPSVKALSEEIGRSMTRDVRFDHASGGCGNI